MRTDRREFLRTACSTAAALTVGSSLSSAMAKAGGGAMKNWVWIPTNTKRTADEWKRRFALMKESGVQAILPEVYGGREAYYASKILPVKTDWLGMILPLAKAEGLEVHAWMWSMPCSNPDVMKNHPDWYNVNALGESALNKPAYVPYYRFLDPGRPEVRRWVQSIVDDLASIPELTGVHLDYIRHPDAILPIGLWKKYNIVQDRVYPQYDYGYSGYERTLFKQKYGPDPISLKSSKLQKKWFQFRLDMVTDLVNLYLVPAAKAKKKMITAAVFPGPKMARTNVMQDWGRWKLDGFLPMLYNRYYEAGPEWVGVQTKEGVRAVKKPVYSGLFVGGMDEAIFTQTVEIARAAGASGVSIFADGGMDDPKWKALQKLTAAKRR